MKKVESGNQLRIQVGYNDTISFTEEDPEPDPKPDLDPGWNKWNE